MLIGIGTCNVFETYGVDGGCQLLRDSGFDCVDFNFDTLCRMDEVYQGKRTSVFSRPLDEVFEFFYPYKEAFKKYGLEVHQSHAPFPTYREGDEASNEFLIQATNKAIAVCKMMDCHYIVAHPAFNEYPDSMPQEKERKVNIALFSSFIDAARKNDVIVCLENVWTRLNGKVYDSVCQDPNDVIWYIDTLNEMAGQECFGFCYDTGHGLMLGKDPYLLFQRLGNRIKVLHMHDNYGTWDQHFPPYNGIMDWERFCMALKSINYEGSLNLEHGGIFRYYPKAVIPEVLKFSNACCRYFAGLIEG